MPDSDLPIELPTDGLSILCRSHAVRRLALFGSVLRPDFSPSSDVDMLVEFQPGTRVSLFDLARVENALTDLLGRQVDLHEMRTLHSAFRDRVASSAREVHVAA